MTHPNWKRRSSRAERLRADHPHAEELLLFYSQILALQEPLYVKARRSKWVSLVRSTASEDGPRLHLERLEGRTRDVLFQHFVHEAGTVSTDVLARIAEQVASRKGTIRTLLQTFLSGGAFDDLAVSFDCKPLPLEFFPRAFVQPIAEALSEREMRSDDNGPGSTAMRCPQCDWPPLLAVLRDEPEFKGRKLLVCSLCSTEWPFVRSRCPSCGEERPEQLQHHVTAFWPHIRIEECSSCHTYLKSIDLRLDGTVVPVVDELASVELDLWADEQGLTKLQKNLLGL